MDLSGNPIPYVKKFMNGWTPEQERLMANWADIAGCYRWLHDKAEKGFSAGNAWITIPVIILSTLTGTASFGLSSFISADQITMKNYAQAGIGTVSIFAGILTTLGNFLRYAQGSAEHRVAGVSWGKLQRQIAVEVSINPNDREDAMTFLQNCRQDLDRLVEQSPPIPDKVIAAFEKEFKDTLNLKRPDICHGLEHTTVFNSTKPRMMKMAADTVIYLKQRKKLLRDDIFPDISERISKKVDTELQAKWRVFEERSRTLAPKPEKAAPPPEPRDTSFMSNWRRFIRNPSTENRQFKEEIYREDSDDDEDRRPDDDDDVVVSVKSESQAHSLTANEIVENISSGSSSSGMVISMKINPDPTPMPAAAPPSITIPGTMPTPAIDVSGVIATIEITGEQTDLSGAGLIE